MKEKGFTIMELSLAVVIFTIAALMLTHILELVVTNNERSESLTLALHYIDNIEQYMTLSEEKELELNEEYDVKIINKKTTSNTIRPISGRVKIGKNGLVETMEKVCINKYYVNYKNKKLIVGEKCTK